MKKKSVAELDHNDLLPVYKSYFAQISWNAQQNLVTFNQNDLQMVSFQIYVTGESKMAVGCCYLK